MTQSSSRSSARFSRILGTGSYLPPKRLSNADLAAQLAADGIETSDAWIVERTGIHARHFADDGVTSSDLALPAARAALEAAGIGADEIDLIIVATSTPDMIFPSTATLLQQKLGRAWLCGVRRAGGLFRLRLRADGGRRDDQDRRCKQGPGDRRRGVLAHPRFQGPHHLRAVRRRGRRRGAGRQRDAGHPGQRTACRWPLRRHPLRAGHAWPAAR